MPDVVRRNGPEPGEGGAPRKVIDADVARRAASIGCTRDEIAAVCGVSPASLYAALKENPQLEADIEEGRNQGRATLRRHQWQQAVAGNPTMLIWLGKQLLGQKDRVELAGDPNKPLNYVVRTPTPIECAQDWLKTYAPADIEIEADAETDGNICD
jgi:hypothetical protein